MIYLDTNIFYNAYCPVEDAEISDWILNQLSTTNKGITSEWTIVEFFRALKKQVNLGTIEEQDAELIVDYFLSEIGEMNQKNELILVPVSKQLIMSTRKEIFNNNLYGADALHLITAMSKSVKAFITYDSDFKGNLKNIPLLNPNDPEFKQKYVQFIRA